MRKIVPMAMEGGGEILFEVEASGYTGDGSVPAGGRGIQDKIHDTFDRAVDTARDCASRLMAKLRDLPDKVTEAQVEFGLEISAEGKVFVVSSQAKGHFTIRLKWTPGKDPGRPSDASA